MTIVDDVDVPAFIAAAKPNLESMGSEFGAEFMARVIRAGAGG